MTTNKDSTNFDKRSQPAVEYERPFLQLPLFEGPPEEYLRWLEEQETLENEAAPRVIIIEL